MAGNDDLDEGQRALSDGESVAVPSRDGSDSDGSNSDGVPRNVSSPTNAKESVQESKQRVYPFYHGWPYLRCPID